MSKKYSYSAFILFAIFLAFTAFSAKTVTVKGTELAQYKGKWIFVSYWADWCGPCRAEIPELNDFYNANKKTTVVLAINADGKTGETGKNLAEQSHIMYPILDSDIASKLHLSVSALPTMFVFNPRGELVTTLIGGQKLSTLENIIYGKK